MSPPISALVPSDITFLSAICEELRAHSILAWISRGIYHRWCNGTVKEPYSTTLSQAAAEAVKELIFNAMFVWQKIWKVPVAEQQNASI